MMKAIRSSAFIAFDLEPESLLAHLDAVIVCKVGQYDSGKDNIIIMLKWVSDIIEPVSNKLSQCWSMSWKWALSSDR